MGLNGHKSLRRKVTYIRDNLGDEVEGAIQSGSETTAAEMRSNVAQQNAVWRGNLFGSIKSESRPTGNHARYRIVADVPYAAFVEFGTGPRSDPTAPLKFQFGSPSHTPQLTQDITAWVMTKPVFFGPRTEEVAWAIAKSIAENGTHPKPFMRPAWFKQKPAIIQHAGFAARQTIRRA